MYDGTKYNLGGLFISQCNNNTILCIDYQYRSTPTPSHSRGKVANYE